MKRYLLTTAAVLALSSMAFAADNTMNTNTSSSSYGNTPATSTSASTTTAVDLNTATQSQLAAIKDIGPAKAQQIVNWRNQHGQFTSATQLNSVLGASTVTRLQQNNQITVNSTTPASQTQNPSSPASKMATPPTTQERTGNMPAEQMNNAAPAPATAPTTTR